MASCYPSRRIFGPNVTGDKTSGAKIIGLEQLSVKMTVTIPTYVE